MIGEETDDSIPRAREARTPSETPGLAVASDRGGPGQTIPQEIPRARQAAQGYPVKEKNSGTRGGPGLVKETSRLPVVTATVITEEGDSRESRKRELDSLAQERRDPKGAAEQQRAYRAQKRWKEEVLDLAQQQSVATKEASDHKEIDSETERKLRGQEFLPQD